MFLIGSLQRGGAEIHLLRVAPKLIKKGWAITIFCLLQRGELADMAEAAGVQIVSPPIELSPSIPRPIRLLLVGLSGLKFLGFLLVGRPFAAHIFLPVTYWIGAPILLLARTPRRLMSRRSRNHYLQSNPVAKRWERFLHRRMTVLLGNSRQVVSDLLQESDDPARVRLIYNGTEMPPLQALVEVRKRIRADLTLGEGLVISCIANLIPYKGHVDLIDAMALVHCRLPPDWVLLLIGRDDGIGEFLQHRAKAAGLEDHVRFLGGRGDVNDLLAATDIFVLPSHEEGFSNALIEAMSAGLPIVATDVGGNSEAIEDGVSGIIVPPRNPPAIAAAVEVVAHCRDLRMRLGVAARNRVREKFSLDSCVDAYDALYRSLE